MVFCVSEKERDEAGDVVFVMVLCVSDSERDEEAEEFEKEREVWKRMILCAGHGVWEQNSVRVISFLFIF